MLPVLITAVEPCTTCTLNDLEPCHKVTEPCATFVQKTQNLYKNYCELRKTAYRVDTKKLTEWTQETHRVLKSSECLKFMLALS